RPGELSGGEQQRVALARALVLSPKLLLADEPTGNLDSATSQSIHELFFKINREHKTTLLVVTHNTAFAQSMPRVVTMRDGRIHADERRPRTEARGEPVEPVVPSVRAPAEAEPAEVAGAGDGVVSASTHHGERDADALASE
ncbi:MAG: ATP-binding cassette domain-containing protein, partial [Polyangiaceae bacterium]|nr:ATP-binding cassette domain-containing protein [Polyangiaceae bacterium]